MIETRKDQRQRKQITNKEKDTTATMVFSRKRDKGDKRTKYKRASKKTTTIK